MDAATEIRPLRPEDHAALFALHRRCAEGGLRQPAPTREAWGWAFERSPHGAHVVVAARGERIVAELGVVQVPTWIDARVADFGCVLAARIDPELRRGLRRPLPLLEAARTLIGTLGAPDRDPVLYGWPDDRTLRLAFRRFAAEVVRPELELVREPGAGALEAPAGVAPIERFGEQARWLYERCSGAFGASTLRHADWAEWRFVDVPGREYARLGVRDGDGILRGWAICAERRGGGSAELRIVDWLVPPAEPEAGAALVAGALALARARGLARVVATIPERSPWFGALQGLGFTVRAGARVLAARNFDRRFDDLWLRAHWWVQPSDDLAV